VRPVVQVKVAKAAATDDAVVVAVVAVRAAVRVAAKAASHVARPEPSTRP
jgi:hypothetical protein